ncbi:MAG: PTS sugar transporter subunit IIA [Verrucomicrobiota bacterium]
MPTALADILDDRLVALQLRARKRDEVVAELVERLAKTGRLREPERFREEVLQRETASSTFAENGIAFPHARTDLVKEIALVVGRSRAGIPWNAAQERAQIIFLLAVPEQAVNDSLIVVGTLARIIRDETCRQSLLSAATPQDFVSLLREAALL